MQYNPEEFNEILNIYKAESEEIIQELNDSFMELEKNPEDKTPLKKLFQLAHSLKGASRMLEINSVQDISHKLEDILSYWKKDNTEINPDFFQVIYKVCDFLNELVDKSVKLKSNYTDENVEIFINKLDNFITENQMIYVKEPVIEPKEFIIKKSDDINAYILELMFVLDKDNISEDFDEVVLVLSEDLKQLAEIFTNTDYIKIKEQIASLLISVDIKKEQEFDIKSFKQKIMDLRKEIYNLYKDLNINTNIPAGKIAKKEQTQTPIEEKKENIKSELSKKFDFVLSNIQKIKYEKDFLNNTTEILKSIIENSDNKQISLILNKTVNILNLFMTKDIVIDNDCYMVILQCIYLAKRISLNEDNGNLNNLDFLIRRLNVVEDMLNINNIQIINREEQTENKSITVQEEYSDLKSSVKSFNLQEIKTLRVDTAKIDNLISQTGELLINGIKTREHIVELSKINSKLLKWNSASKKIINYLKYLEKKGFFSSKTDDSALAFYRKAQNFFSGNAAIVNEINSDFANLYTIISEDDNKLHQTAVEIETIAKGIRVLPLATLFHSFPRMIRDIAKENNKKIDFIISGSDTTVDKKIIEEIKMPLIHILRNSVSHGIETPENRIKNNKPETGIIKLEARQIENYVIITVEDDGYGIDIEKVKQTALQKGILSKEETEALDSEQIMKLLFLPGFSTEESVTEISGRGIGLDVVKTKITNLNGDIFIDSVLNKGCKVMIKLPLSMSTIKAFILLVNNQKYALPISSIKFVKQIKKEEIFKKNGVNSIIFDGHSIPVYFLSEIFNEPNNIINEEQYTLIIIENQENQAAYIIDKLLGDLEVFQKKLIPPILRIRNISGFTTLSTGEICLIINPYELIRNTISVLKLSFAESKKITSQENKI